MQQCVNAQCRLYCGSGQMLGWPTEAASWIVCPNLLRNSMQIHSSADATLLSKFKSLTLHWCISSVWAGKCLCDGIFLQSVLFQTVNISIIRLELSSEESIMMLFDGPSSSFLLCGFTIQSELHSVARHIGPWKSARLAACWADPLMQRFEVRFRISELCFLSFLSFFLWWNNSLGRAIHQAIPWSQTACRPRLRRRLRFGFGTDQLQRLPHVRGRCSANPCRTTPLEGMPRCGASHTRAQLREGSAEKPPPIPLLWARSRLHLRGFRGFRDMKKIYSGIYYI